MIFCTLTTSSHLYKCAVLAKSLERFGYELYVCQIDKTTYAPNDVQLNFKTIELSALGQEVAVFKRRYKKDQWRWALKPILMRHLLTTTSEKVVYVDNDFYFFNSPIEVQDQLEKFDVLLTPHHYCHEPDEQPNWFEANFRVGLYNAGFVAANQNAMPALEWWSRCCMYNMKKSAWRGLYDDQKYLDLLAVKFPKIGLLEPARFNVAGWNDWQFEHRTEQAAHIVCVHFADLTLRKFAQPVHPLNELFVAYQKAFKQEGSLLQINELRSFDWRRIPTFLYFLVWKIVRSFEK